MSSPFLDRATFDRLHAYAADRLAGRPADPTVVITGLPHAGLASAELRQDADGRLFIEAVIEDRYGGGSELRSPRLFDPATLTVVRLLCAAGGAVRLQRTNFAPHRPRELHYPVLGDNISLGRIIADAGPGQKVVQRADHHDWRRHSLRVALSIPLDERQGRTRRGRADALDVALDHYDRAAAKEPLPFTRDELLDAIRTAFDALDRVPMDQPEADAAE